MFLLVQLTLGIVCCDPSFESDYERQVLVPEKRAVGIVLLSDADCDAHVLSSTGDSTKVGICVRI